MTDISTQTLIDSLREEYEQQARLYANDADHTLSLAADRLEKLEEENKRIKMNHGCARHQQSTQYCQESVDIQAKLDKANRSICLLAKAGHEQEDELKIALEHIRATREMLMMEIEDLSFPLDFPEDLHCADIVEKRLMRPVRYIMELQDAKLDKANKTIKTLKNLLLQISRESAFHSCIEIDTHAKPPLDGVQWMKDVRAALEDK